LITQIKVQLLRVEVLSNNNLDLLSIRSWTVLCV